MTITNKHTEALKMLDELETTIFACFKKKKHSLTTKEVYDSLKMKKRPAYNTVARRILRLKALGLISRREHDALCIGRKPRTKCSWYLTEG